VIGNGTIAGRNVISGNGHRGIYLSNADNTVIQGNYIGTNAAGTADVNGTTPNNFQSGIVVLRLVPRVSRSVVTPLVKAM
jgi:parallel beta-helix repeat protein